MEEQKKRRTRRKFTDEYKARAFRLVLKEGQKATQVARDLGRRAGMKPTIVVDRCRE